MGPRSVLLLSLNFYCVAGLPSTFGILGSNLIEVGLEGLIRVDLVAPVCVEDPVSDKRLGLTLRLRIVDADADIVLRRIELDTICGTSLCTSLRTLNSYQGLTPVDNIQEVLVL
jgi:hypothetical protein